jgi:hypothetical protein
MNQEIPPVGAVAEQPSVVVEPAVPDAHLKPLLSQIEQRANPPASRSAR